MDIFAARAMEQGTIASSVLNSRLPRTLPRTIFEFASGGGQFDQSRTRRGLVGWVLNSSSVDIHWVAAHSVNHMERHPRACSELGAAGSRAGDGGTGSINDPHSLALKYARHRMRRPLVEFMFDNHSHAPVPWWHCVDEPGSSLPYLKQRAYANHSALRCSDGPLWNEVKSPPSCGVAVAHMA